MNNYIVDLSHTLGPQTPVFPGDRSPLFTQTATLKADGYNALTYCGGMHIGTHVDMPMHMTADTRAAHQFPLDAFCGRANLVPVWGESLITTQMLGKIDCDIVILATGWSERFGKDDYFSAHPCIGMDAAEMLVNAGVRLVGMDMPSPDKPPFPVHRFLLEHGVCIAENLTGLKALEGKDFFFCAAPLKIRAEGSPVRAFAIVPG